MRLSMLCRPCGRVGDRRGAQQRIIAAALVVVEDRKAGDERAVSDHDDHKEKDGDHQAAKHDRDDRDGLFDLHVEGRSDCDGDNPEQNGDNFDRKDPETADQVNHEQDQKNASFRAVGELRAAAEGRAGPTLL